MKGQALEDGVLVLAEANERWGDANRKQVKIKGVLLNTERFDRFQSYFQKRACFKCQLSWQ